MLLHPLPELTLLGLSVNLLVLLTLTHIFFPRARSRTNKFFYMSYYNPETKMYGCGTDDLPFVLLWSVIFTGVRVAVMEYLLDPLARLGGIRTKKGLDRFKEQAWLIVYYTGSWSLGMVRLPLVAENYGECQRCANQVNSTSCTTPSSGSISMASGRVGPSAKQTASSSGTTLFNGAFGSSRFLSSTLRKNARTMRRC